MDQIEKPYGPWMKSEPKHRNYTLGAQWLRKGGNFPVNSPAKARDEAQGISVTVIHAVDRHNPEVSGNRRNNMEANEKELWLLEI